MSDKRKLPAHEAWDALQRMALRDEAERVSALSDTQLDQELAAKGIDPKALRARGAALAETLRATEPEPQGRERVRKISTREGRRWAILLSAASFAAGALTVGIPAAVILRPAARPQQSTLPPAASLEGQVANLRRFAKDACGRRQWVDCRQALEAARLLDPLGEDSAEVHRERTAIGEGLNSPER